MAVSRYRNTQKINGQYLETFDFPKIDLNKIQTFSIRITDQDRMDTLASRFLGDGNYWWIIAHINGINFPWDFASGEIIKIPVDVSEILKFF